MPDLPRRVEELSVEVSKLREAVENFRPEIDAARRSAFRTATFVALLLLVSVGLGWNAVQQSATSSRLESAIDGAFCPLYALFIGSYNPETRAAGPDRIKYEEAFVDLRRQRDALGCRNPDVPPRIGG